MLDILDHHRVVAFLNQGNDAQMSSGRVARCARIQTTRLEDVRGEVA